MIRRWLAGWRVPLRIACRDARRSRARTTLALVLLVLPVLAVTVADSLFATAEITGDEAVERRLGQAEVRIELGAELAYQGADPDQGSVSEGGRGGAADLAEAAATLGDPGLAASAVPLQEGLMSYGTELGRDDAQTLTTDLGDPLTAGLVDLTSGRLPRSTGEVVVNAALSEEGPGVGEDLVLADGTRLEIVGAAESATIVGEPFVAGLPGSPLGEDASRATQYLLDSGPVSWAQVRTLNELGVLVLSRAVLADPPSDDELPPAVAFVTNQLDAAAVTASVLIATMVLIEVVLLAGPAFAVGARRQARTLALVAATGGTVRDTCRVVLGSGVILGLGGAGLGVVLGVAVAWLLQPVVQRFSIGRLGPFDVVPTHLLAVAAFGLVSALLAAALPAWATSRQDVVAVLAGRRGDPRPSRRSPIAGLVLLGLGVAGATYGARAASGGETVIAGAAIVCVLGMLLLIPVVVSALARLARGLPLVLRFAARDAARHRSRTVPAVAAVAATVAGVVALGIGLASDQAENEATYQPVLAEGDGAVGLTGFGGRPVDEDAVRDALGSTLPDAEVEDVTGVVGRGYAELRAPGAAELLSSWHGVTGDLLVSGEGLPSALRGVVPLSAEDDVAVERVLARGGVVVLSDSGAEVDEVRLVSFPRRGQPVRTLLPAVTLAVEPGTATTQGVLAPEAARAAGLEVGTTSLLLTGDLSTDATDEAEQAVAGVDPDVSLYVERGYQEDEAVLILQVVLGALAAVLMLGGTLTATFLALNDARPDLATLGAVGAAPRTGRAVAAAYALVVGGVGAVLGVLVGLVPGIAVTYPLTRPYGLGLGEVSGASHYLDVPWLLLGVVVVVLPLLSAVVVAAVSRSRLPLAARVQ